MSSLMDSQWAAMPQPAPKDGESGLSASRWAATPPLPSGEAAKKETGTSLFSSRWADTPPPDELEQSVNGAAKRQEDDEGKSALEASHEDKSRLKERKTSGGDTNSVKGEVSGAASEVVENVEVAPQSNQNILFEREVSQTGTPFTSSAGFGTAPVSPTKSRFELPRVKRKVRWGERNLIISLPNLDYKAMGLVQPLSFDEVEARLNAFKEAGYDTAGFDMPRDDSLDEPVHVKPIYPDETEVGGSTSRESAKVILPDLRKWTDYMNWLTEQKLAALGVSTGSEEPSAAPSQDMSRQSSGQYPGLPFSPPLPTSSAGSMSRPGMVRGHSHTMSVASPVSPLNGPFGHMHRHSTFSGPLSLQQMQIPNQQSIAQSIRAFSPQGQPPLQQPPIPGMQSFSPQNQFAPPNFNRTGSPAQLQALRNDVGRLRGPGSPLGQQITPQSPQDYSRMIAEDQMRRQQAYPQQPPQPSMPDVFAPQSSNVQPAHPLPELPEEDDEEELTREPESEKEPEPEAAPEPPAYVPPHKRAQLNANIAVPTPRGHRHNISEGLERDILEAEKRHEAERQNWIEVDEEESGEQSSRSDQKSSLADTFSYAEKDPLSQDYPVQETSHNYKKSASRFNVAAPSFKFNPGASFQPASTAFTFGAPAPQTNARTSFGHSRQQSSGNFNAAAPAFKPSGMNSMPKSEFSFTSSGPSFKPNAPAFKPQEQRTHEPTPSIFGKVEIPDIVKPARRSKALPIVRPDTSSRDVNGSSEEQEDEDGRIVQSDDRLKRQRKAGDDGDEVPKFAEPQPVPPPPSDLILKSQPNEVEESLDYGEPAESVHRGIDPTHDTAEVKDVAGSPEHALSRSVEPNVEAEYQQHKPATSLSALAKPFEPVFPSDSQTHSVHQPKPSSASISDLEEGELREDEHPATSPIRSAESSMARDLADSRSSSAVPEPLQPFGQPASARVDNFDLAEPSFDEIDAVMRQLNEAEDNMKAEGSPDISPLPSPGAHPMQGVTYLPEWSRSDAPSPSPRRQPPQFNSQVDSSFTIHDRTDSGDRAMNGFTHINRLNKAEELPTSDWSGEFSGPDEEKLNQRGHFFDAHVDDLVGRVVEKRLQPLEESLRSIQNAVSRRPASSDRLQQKRSSSAVESDADDEDEMSEEQRQRPISRGRDKRADQIKAAVLEALREQSPRRRSQSSYDIQELHSVLADMKMSFARAASEGLDLEDIRAVVDEAMVKQSHVQDQNAADESEKTHAHRREMSDLERRLNETLAGALEETNQRRAAEERETQLKRELRLAEEELQLLRDSSRDDDSRFNAAEHIREELLRRAEEAEASQRDMEEQIKNLEAENSATYATLEEYRMSSNKWRQDIDHSTREREDLERMISDLERQLEESQESGSSMRRRLEKLHSDMATATGQLASEKASWKAKEEDYGAKCESLETQVAAHAMKRSELEQELGDLRAGAKEASEARLVMEQVKVSNTSLDEMVRTLQNQLAEQQSLAARFERDFHDAREAGRDEVHRTRMALETDLEAANHQVNIVRAEMEAELSKVRAELENVQMEAETAKARHERTLEDEDTARRETLRKVNHASSVAFDEARQKHETAIQELQAAHKRTLDHAVEDKQRSEYFLNERLSLSDAKLQHFQDRVLHLEERLEVAKSAAQAAAISAQSRAIPAATSSTAALPEKVSPQALRESILVLQEQLQDRESQIEKLQNQADNEAPAKLKKSDEEIAWLRELLSVRSEELTDLVNTLAQPTFDRSAVRDTAIRIRANLQMEQQEKERFSQNPQSGAGQAIASLSNFATPKAAQLSSAFQKWRTNMESSALKNAPRGSGRPRSSTPSKPSSSAAAIPPGYMAGLMTPPASNLRNTPSPEATGSLPPPRLHSRPTSKSNNVPFSEPPKLRSRQTSVASDAPTTPLFRSQSYDQDAEDNKVHMESFEESVEDEDLDVADNQPPAFRSLSEELEDSVDDDSMV